MSTKGHRSRLACTASGEVVFDFPGTARSSKNSEKTSKWSDHRHPARAAKGPATPTARKPPRKRLESRARSHPLFPRSPKRGLIDAIRAPAALDRLSAFTRRGRNKTAPRPRREVPGRLAMPPSNCGSCAYRRSAEVQLNVVFVSVIGAGTPRLRSLRVGGALLAQPFLKLYRRRTQRLFGLEGGETLRERVTADL